MSKITYPDETLADNDKTVELLIQKSGGTQEELAKIKKWGKDRKARIDILCKLAGLLKEKGVFRSGKGQMSRIESCFAIQHCVAIATKHGLEMEYKFNDNEYGPFSPDLSIDLHAVEPVDVNTPTGVFPNKKAELQFLEDIEGKSAEELGEFARSIVIEDRYRILV